MCSVHCRVGLSLLCPREWEAGARFIRGGVGVGGGVRTLTLWSTACHNPDLTFQWLVV